MTRIKLLRKKKKITQEEMATLLNMRVERYRRIENNKLKYGIKPSTYRAIAEILNTDVADLRQGVGK